MLTLSRRVGESILIGPDVRVQVIDVSQNKARIGIDAPREVAIFRAELVTPGEPLPPSQGNAVYLRLQRAREALLKIATGGVSTTGYDVLAKDYAMRDFARAALAETE